MKFDFPIPGASLTREPGNSPWEQPPLYNTKEEVLSHYFSKMEDEEIFDDMLFLIEEGLPISVFVDSLTSVGVMEGYHTFDVKMLVDPVLHEHIKSVADAANITYIEDSGPTREERDKERITSRTKIKLEKALSEINPPTDEADLEMMTPEEGSTEEAVPEEPAPKTSPLIPRRM